MIFEYAPQGVCSRLMTFEIEDDRILSLRIDGGCVGNLRGIASLIKGMRVEDVIERLDGTLCRGKSTSCPDQIARALKSYLAQRSELGGGG